MPSHEHADGYPGQYTDGDPDEHDNGNDESDADADANWDIHADEYDY